MSKRLVLSTFLPALFLLSSAAPASSEDELSPRTDGMAPHPAFAEGQLTGNIVISSSNLGYDLQYRVYLPDGYKSMTDLPVLYVADGQWYIESGDMPAELNRLIDSGSIDPAIVVFIDNRNPHNLNQNRRNREFFCNDRYPTRSTRDGRAVLGLSFGGLNAACFGLHAHQDVGAIAMQSPATHTVPYIHSAFADSTNLDLRIFLSSGDRDDNETRTRTLRDILDRKRYQMEYVEVPYGHNWQNWRPLIDDLLLFFYGRSN